MKISLLAIFLIVLSASCDKDADGPALATFDDETISAQEFAISIPPEVWKYMSEKEKKDYLNKYIDKEMIIHDVHNRKLDDDPLVQARLKEARQEILGQVFLDVVVNPRIDIEEEDIKDYYRQHQVQFARDKDEVLLYQLIFLNSDTADSAFEILAEREDSLKRQDFVEVAESFGLDTAEVDKGFIARENLIDEIDKKLKRSKPGDLIGPIETNFGFVIIFYKEFGASGTLHPLACVREEIENILYRKKQIEMKKNLVDSLREYHKPKIDQAVYDSFLMRDKDI